MVKMADVMVKGGKETMRMDMARLSEQWYKVSIEEMTRQ